MLDAFEAAVSLLVAEYSPELLFVHAGVVAHGGRAIVLPGRTMAGKTTLVAALVQQGAVYYSDEFAAFDGAGSVLPFPRAPQLRAPDLKSQTRLDPHREGWQVGSTPIPVGLVAFCRYREGANWRPRRLTAGEASLGLLANTVPARRRPEACLRLVHSLFPTVLGLRGTRGEASETARRLLRRLERSNAREFR